jgi:hypothetical protein
MNNAVASAITKRIAYGMNHTRCSVLLALFCACLLQPSTAMSVTYWDSFLQLGFHPAKEAVEVQTAYHNIETIIEYRLRKDAPIEYDRETSKLIKEVKDQIASMDAGNLYDSMPHNHPETTWRGVGMTKSWQTDHYHVFVTDPKLTNWLSSAQHARHLAWNPKSELGDWELRAFVAPITHETIRLVTCFQFHLNGINGSTIMRIPPMITETSTNLCHGGETPSKDFLYNGNLEIPEQRILFQVKKDFPHLFAVLNRYFKFKSILKEKLPQKDAPTRFDITVTLEKELITRDFPKLGKFLSNLGDRLRVTKKVKNKENHIIWKSNFDSENLTLQSRFTALKGTMVGMDQGMHPIPSSCFHMAIPGKTSLTADYTINLHVAGLHVDINNLEIDLDYTYNTDQASIMASLTRPPGEIKVSGYMLGIIPVWLFDLIIPSNLEDILRGFFLVLCDNQGRGAMLAVATTPLDDTWNLTMQSDMEVISNGIIKLAFRLSRRFAKDRSELRTDIKQLKKAIWTALKNDYHLMRSPGNKVADVP